MCDSVRLLYLLTYFNFLETRDAPRNTSPAIVTDAAIGDPEAPRRFNLNAAQR